VECTLGETRRVLAPKSTIPDSGTPPDFLRRWRRVAAKGRSDADAAGSWRSASGIGRGRGRSAASAPGAVSDWQWIVDTTVRCARRTPHAERYHRASCLTTRLFHETRARPTTRPTKPTKPTKPSERHIHSHTYRHGSFTEHPNDLCCCTFSLQTLSGRCPRLNA
jgi:hypothetical protein